jgi:long-chain fatty acid transport protein
MKCTLMVVLMVVLCAAGTASAQNPIPERLLLSTGQNVPPSARALGLGGTYTGIADDYSSIWWNPAGLAQVKRIEIQGGLSRSGYSDKTNYFGGNESGSTNSIRLNDVGMVFPVPVYQGALTFAFGYNQLMAYDRRTRINAPSPDPSHYWDNFDELEDGRLGQWVMAAAMDVSPNLSLGLGLQYWTGVDDYTKTGNFSTFDTAGHIFQNYSERLINTDLSGWGANIGAMYHGGRYTRVGVMFQTPISMDLNEDHTFTGTSGTFDYRMTYPAVLRAGASFSPGRWLLGADVEYRDWTAMQFRSDTPFDSVSQADGNVQIKNTYKATTRVSVGGEYLFPQFGLRARAGYAYEPANYMHTDNKNLISFGLGVLVDKNVMVDAGFQFTAFKQTTNDGEPRYWVPTGGALGNISEKINSNTALVTLSYRM